MAEPRTHYDQRRGNLGFQAVSRHLFSFRNLFSLESICDA